MKYNFEELKDKIENNCTELNQLYQEAKEERKKMGKRAIGTCLVIDIVLVAVILFITKGSKFSFPFFVVPIIMIDMLTVFLFGAFGKKQKEYRKTYKQVVIKQLIENFYDQLEYFPEKEMPQEIYREGKYVGYYNRYSSDDYLEAKINNQYLIDMAEVETVREETHTDSNGNTRTTRTTIFHGLFAKIMLDKSIGCDFRIARGSKISAYKNRLEMDSSEFEKTFNVYTSNSIVGMQLLTADIMEELLDFQNRIKVPFDVYIEENNLYIRFLCGSMFEIRNFTKGILDEKSLQSYFDILKFMESLSKKIAKVIDETEI